MVQVNKSSWEYFIVKIATGQIGELNYDKDINKILQLIQLFQDKSKLAEFGHCILARDVSRNILFRHAESQDKKTNKYIRLCCIFVNYVRFFIKKILGNTLSCYLL